jgi:hypothetical protein
MVVYPSQQNEVFRAILNLFSNSSLVGKVLEVHKHFKNQPDMARNYDDSSKITTDETFISQI